MIYIQRNALKAVSLFKAVKDVRYYLNGVCVKASPTETRLIATDGHTLAVHRQQFSNDRYLPELIIPSDTVKTVLAWKSVNKACADMPMELTITSDTEARITWQGDKIAVFKPIDGKFPDYTRVIPESLTGETAQFNPDYIARCQRARECFGNAYFVEIGHNGTGPALINVDESMAVVVMPIRGSAPDASGFQWAREDIPQEVKATVSDDVAEHETV